ncbi:MAG: hypothetical protein HYX75_13445 [Acidobacteria bacterium]|nr:hypothetical protein [Acidobacteriota bacterium]
MKKVESLDPRLVDEFVARIMTLQTWNEWVEANDKFERDGTLQGLLQRHEQIASRFRVARAAGRGLSGVLTSELVRVEEKVRGNENFRRREESFEVLARVMRQINQMLSPRLGLDFAALAAPPRGGCCG